MPTGPNTPSWTAEIDGVELLRKMLITRLGPEATEAFIARITDPVRNQLEPQAVGAEIQRVMSTLWTGMTQAEIADVALGLAPHLDRLLAAPIPALSSSAAAATEAVLRDATPVLGPGRIVELLAPMRDIDPNTVRPSGLLMNDDVKNSFEAHHANMVRMISAHAEGVYKPTLRCLLSVTLASKGQSTATPNQIGQVTKLAHETWPAELCKELLMPNIRIVRNSDGHFHTAYDSVARIVTFTNEATDGRMTRVTMTAVEFEKYATTFARVWAGMFVTARKAAGA